VEVGLVEWVVPEQQTSPLYTRCFILFDCVDEELPVSDLISKDLVREVTMIISILTHLLSKTLILCHNLIVSLSDI
jgi:hypothetical protein